MALNKQCSVWSFGPTVTIPSLCAILRTVASEGAGFSGRSELRVLTVVKASEVLWCYPLYTSKKEGDNKLPKMFCFSFYSAGTTSGTKLIG
jgi:hypothetical protein